MLKRLALLLALLLLTGCAARKTASSGNTAQPLPLSSASAAEQATDFTAVIDTKEMDFTFTERELAGTYEAHKAVSIHGQGTTAAIDGAGATLSDKTLTISTEGVYILSGTFSDLCITISVGEKDKVQLVLDQAQLTNSLGPCIYAKEADKVFITLPEDSHSTVSDGASYAISDGDSALDAAIFSKADLCINGKGSLTINGVSKHGIVCKDDLIIAGPVLTVTAASTALDGKDCVMITGASLTLDAGSNGIRSSNAENENRGYVYLQDTTATITSGNDGIQAETVLVCERVTLDVTAGGGSGQSLRNASGSWKGLKSGGDMYLGSGTYAVSSRDDCIHANSSIFVADGTYTLSSGDDGIHADTNLTISGGDIAISKSYEGLEASKLTIAGGQINVTASDDGLNAAGGADGSAMGNRFGRGMFSNGIGEIVISGGYTVVNASGDGIDSNASILVSGGITLVSGPVSSGNAAFDYDGSAKVTGGILIATGTMGMAQNFSEAENQGAMLVSIGSRQSGESLALTDADGRVLASFTPASTYQCAVITAPGIQQGQIYTLLTGCTVEGADAHGFAQNTTATGGTPIDQITMSSLLYGGGSGMRNKPGNFGPGGGGGKNRHGW